MTFVLVLVVLIAAGALLVAAVTAARNAGLLTTYRRVASQFHGEVDTRGVFGWPTARITHRDAMATAGVVGRWGMRATQVEIREQAVGPCDEHIVSAFDPLTAPVPKARAALALDCEIIPASMLQRMAYLIGSRKPVSESPNFDLQYVISTDDREQARRLLTRYVQVQIDRLRYFQGGNDIHVRIHDGAVVVNRRGVIRHERALRQFIALALELYEQAAASVGAGIDIVPTTGQPAEDAVCKVCGDPLGGEEDEVVFCRVCETPHHRDCWRYFGGCSVYACGERRFTRAPRLAREKR